MELKWTDVLIFFTFILIILYYLWRRGVNKVREKGLKFKDPVPLFGNNLKGVFRMQHLLQLLEEIYYKFPDERYVAYFNFHNVNIMIRDPLLISEVTLKHFDHFVDHNSSFLDPKSDPIIANGLFVMKGERWKDMRASLTPAFTGSKMKGMVPFIKDCSKLLISHINNEIDKGDGIYEVELKDLMTKCASDSIASCAFGIVTDSLKDQNNDFYRIAKLATQFQLRDIVRAIPKMMFPKLCEFLGIPFMRKEVIEYYRQIVKTIMDEREKSGVIRKDMIHLLMLAKKGKLQGESTSVDVEECKDLTEFYDNLVEKRGFKQNWTDDEIAAQAFLFLLAGFEPTSIMMCFLFYELTVNEHCQKKLQKEIDDHIEANGEDIDYAQINQLKYLNMVISETLRNRPSIPFMDRVCTKEFELPPTGNNTSGLKIKLNDVVMFPTAALHKDPKYWEDPEKFDPERFSDENKSKITPNTYLPFGTGPRSCIGNRFALMECKILAFYILSNFDLKIIPRTEIPLTMSNVMFSMVVKNGFWIGFQKRRR